MAPSPHSHSVTLAALSLALLLGACATAPEVVRTAPATAASGPAPGPSNVARATTSPAIVPVPPQPLAAITEIKRDRSSELTVYALSLVGVKYKFGGNSATTGFDCSGFVNHVFGEVVNFALPRSSEAIAQRGVVVGRNDLQPGDLVFYNTRSRANSHVGIYLGNNTFVHAPSRGKNVEIVDMTDNYWRKRFVGARRLLSDSPLANSIDTASSTAQKIRFAKPDVSRSAAVNKQANGGQLDGMPIIDGQ